MNYSTRSKAKSDRQQSPKNLFSILLFLPLFLLSNCAHAAIKFYDNASGSPLLGLINQAQSTLDIEIYEMDDRHVEDAIKSAMDRGVKVRIVHEGSPVGASCHVFNDPESKDTDDCARQKAFVNTVNQQGGTYVPFNKDLCGTPGSRCYEHGKMVLVDQRTALISTGNFNSSNLCDLEENPSTCNRDYTLVDDDSSVVATLESIFTQDLNGTPYDVKVSIYANGAGDILTVSPYAMDPLVNFINSAQSKLVIETQYLKDPTLNDAILNAAKRGVKVYVMVTSACAFGKPKSSEINQWNDTYGAFDNAGIVTRAFDKKMKINGKAGYLHAKAIVVDDSRAWVGSVNGSTTSLTDNREFGVFSDDSQLVQQLYQFMTSDLNNDQAETWQESLDCTKDHG